MSRLLEGGLLVLFVIVLAFIVGTVSALFTNATGPEGDEFTNCDTEDNFTTCQNAGRDNLLGEIFTASIFPIPAESSDFAAFLNVIYLMVLGFFLAIGIVLIVLAFVPTTAA